jgi:hypothetical protein
MLSLILGHTITPQDSIVCKDTIKEMIKETIEEQEKMCQKWTYLPEKMLLISP